jgi:hypothetical protein
LREPDAHVLKPDAAVADPDADVVLLPLIN